MPSGLLWILAVGLGMASRRLQDAKRAIGRSPGGQTRFGMESRLFQARRQGRQLFAEGARQLRIGRAHRHQHFPAALAEPDIHALLALIYL